MSTNSDARERIVRKALEATLGDVDKAYFIAEKEYRRFVGREPSFGEAQHISTLIDTISYAPYRNHYEKKTDSTETKPDVARRYRDLKG